MSKPPSDVPLLLPQVITTVAKTGRGFVATIILPADGLEAAATPQLQWCADASRGGITSAWRCNASDCRHAIATRVKIITSAADPVYQVSEHARRILNCRVLIHCRGVYRTSPAKWFHPKSVVPADSSPSGGGMRSSFAARRGGGYEAQLTFEATLAPLTFAFTVLLPAADGAEEAKLRARGGAPFTVPIGMQPGSPAILGADGLPVECLCHAVNPAACLYLETRCGCWDAVLGIGAQISEEEPGSTRWRPTRVS